MQVVTGDEMREVDRIIIEELGIPGVVLMEHAGYQAALTIANKYDTLGRILIIAGKGNNGGDGFVVHRWLTHWGFDCTTLLLATRDEIKGDAKVNLKILSNIGETIVEIKTEKELDHFWQQIERFDLIIDAILGTGLKGEVRGLSKLAIELVNLADLAVVAIDIPSGLDSVRGIPLGFAVEADFTVTFGLPKIGLILSPGKFYTGEFKIIDIGIPESVIVKAGNQQYWLTADQVSEMLPLRADDGHKGTFGKVLILAGSKGMTGAAALTSEAVLRSGAGLATLGIPESLNSILEVKLTEVMTSPLPETDGQLSSRGMEQIKKLAAKADVLAVGPGLGQSDEIAQIIEMVLSLDKPLVIDADGLNNLQELLFILKTRQALTVLTPHPGEMARLLGISVAELKTNKIDLAERFAREYGVILILKDAPTIIAFPDGRVYFSSTGNNGMGTGGTGDVLTGILSGFLAQSNDQMVIPAAVYLHGLAGDLYSEKTSQRTLLASDLLSGLALALQKIEDS